jgi:hypothetical protein
MSNMKTVALVDAENRAQANTINDAINAAIDASVAVALGLVQEDLDEIRKRLDRLERATHGDGR